MERRLRGDSEHQSDAHCQKARLTSCCLCSAAVLPYGCLEPAFAQAFTSRLPLTSNILGLLSSIGLAAIEQLGNCISSVPHWPLILQLLWFYSCSDFTVDCRWCLAVKHGSDHLLTPVPVPGTWEPGSWGTNIRTENWRCKEKMVVCLLLTSQFQCLLRVEARRLQWAQWQPC